MIDKDDCAEIARYIFGKGKDIHFVIIVYDSNGNQQQFGYGCEKCASEILFNVAGELANKHHSNDHHKSVN